MSDVIWAAIVAAGVSGIVSVVGNMTTYYVSKKQSETSIATANRQAEVELRKAREETERLREQHREAERQNRQGTYHRITALMNRLERFATGFPPENFDEFQRAVDELNDLTAGLDLFGGREVGQANAKVSEVFAVIGKRVPPKGSVPPPHEVWVDEYRKHIDAVRFVEAELVQAMRKDIGVSDD